MTLNFLPPIFTPLRGAQCWRLAVLLVFCLALISCSGDQQPPAALTQVQVAAALPGWLVLKSLDVEYRELSKEPKTLLAQLRLAVTSTEPLYEISQNGSPEAMSAIEKGQQVVTPDAENAEQALADPLVLQSRRAFAKQAKLAQGTTWLKVVLEKGSEATLYGKLNAKWDGKQWQFTPVAFESVLRQFGQPRSSYPAGAIVLGSSAATELETKVGAAADGVLLALEQSSRRKEERQTAEAEKKQKRADEHRARLLAMTAKGTRYEGRVIPNPNLYTAPPFPVVVEFSQQGQGGQAMEIQVSGLGANVRFSRRFSGRLELDERKANGQPLQLSADAPQLQSPAASTFFTENTNATLNCSLVENHLTGEAVGSGYRFAIDAFRKE